MSNESHLPYKISARNIYQGTITEESNYLQAAIYASVQELQNANGQLIPCTDPNNKKYTDNNPEANKAALERDLDGDVLINDEKYIATDNSSSEQFIQNKLGNNHPLSGCYTQTAKGFIETYLHQYLPFNPASATYDPKRRCEIFYNSKTENTTLIATSIPCGRFNPDKSPDDNFFAGTVQTRWKVVPLQNENSQSKEEKQAQKNPLCALELVEICTSNEQLKKLLKEAPPVKNQLQDMIKQANEAEKNRLYKMVDSLNDGGLLPYEALVNLCNLQEHAEKTNSKDLAKLNQYVEKVRKAVLNNINNNKNLSYQNKTALTFVLRSAIKDYIKETLSKNTPIQAITFEMEDRHINEEDGQITLKLRQLKVNGQFCKTETQPIQEICLKLNFNEKNEPEFASENLDKADFSIPPPQPLLNINGTVSPSKRAGHEKFSLIQWLGSLLQQLHTLLATTEIGLPPHSPKPLLKNSPNKIITGLENSNNCQAALSAQNQKKEKEKEEEESEAEETSKGDLPPPKKPSYPYSPLICPTATGMNVR